MEQLSAQRKDSWDQIIINTHPDRCPHCHYSIVPSYNGATVDKNGAYLSYFCIRNECGRFFIYEYDETAASHYYLNRPVGGTVLATEYSETINGISGSFVDIYQQAEEAEHHGLKDICGVGYRKALEFLIKDYIIHTYPELKSIVENKLLAACIGDHIDNKKIVDISKRAVWIGNDETHYVRKWEGMDISHLKQLIALTVHWIETEYLTQQMIADMPDPKKK